MDHLVLLATPSGRWVLPAGEEFHAALGDPRPDFDGPAYAVRNLGFIRLQVIDHRLIEIELYPRNVAPRALRAVIDQIMTSEVSLFRIKYLDGGWQSEIFASVAPAIDRLEELCAPVFRPTASEAFSADPQSVAALLDSRSYEDHAFRPLAQKWRVSFGRFDESVLHMAASHELLSRLAIIRVNPPDGDATFRYLGPGHTWITEDFKFNGIGSRVEDVPDKAYGKWVSQFYRAAAASGEPRLDRITATMNYYPEDGVDRPPRRVTYDRVLLPWKTESDGIFVTSCSKLVDMPVGKESGAANFAPMPSLRSLSRNSAKSS